MWWLMSTAESFFKFEKGKNSSVLPHLSWHNSAGEYIMITSIQFEVTARSLPLSFSLWPPSVLRRCGLAVLGRLVKPQLKTHLKKGATFFRPWQQNFFGQNSRNGENGQINYWAKWKSKKENWKMETAASFKKQFDGEPRLECHERTANGAWAERGTNCAYDMCVARLRTEVTHRTDKHLD